MTGSEAMGSVAVIVAGISTFFFVRLGGMIVSIEVGNWTYSNVEYGEQEHGKGMNRNECRESNEL